MNKNRLEAFSDGVFAIVITLLILDVKLPNNSTQPIWTNVKSIIPNLLSFIFSFIIIGVYWVAHHSMMHYIKKVNRTALWLNMLLLLTITLIPFPASLLGRYPKSETALWLYAINLIIVNIAGSIFWWYCSGKQGICEEQLDLRLRRKILWIHLSPVLLYSIAAFLSFISIYITYMLFIIISAFFIIPNPLFVRLMK